MSDVAKMVTEIARNIVLIFERNNQSSLLLGAALNMQPLANSDRIIEKNIVMKSECTIGKVSGTPYFCKNA